MTEIYEAGQDFQVGPIGVRSEPKSNPAIEQQDLNGDVARERFQSASLSTKNAGILILISVDFLLKNFISFILY